MSPKTTKSGEIIPRETSSAERMADLLKRMSGEISRALPKHVTGDRMARIALTALRTTPRLTDCTPGSVLGCIMQCSQLGLEPNTPLQHAYLIPRRIKGVYTCTLIIGYQGYIELSRRSGLVSGIKGHVVREGDEFEYSEGLVPVLRHVPSQDPDRETRPITHAYAIARMKGLDPEFEVLSLAQIKARMQRSSSSGGYSPWQTDFDAMAKKTAVRALWKWLPKSSELAVAEAVETAVEVHGDQSEAWDSSVSDALESQGLLSESSPTEEAPDGQTAD